jgi:SpoVK/Ycf46/Vps4 family AAA+-type ATPase
MRTEKEKVLREIRVLIGSGYPIIQVISWEQNRVIKDLFSSLKGKNVFYWTGYSGLSRVAGVENSNIVLEPVLTDKAILPYIMNYKDKGVFVLQDFHLFMFDPNTEKPVESVLSALRHFAESPDAKGKTIIFLGPVLCVPLELEKSINIVDYPLPEYAEIEGILSEITKIAEKKFKIDKDPALLEKAINAARGLTYDEIERIYKKIIIEDAKFDSSDLKKLIENKKQIIRQKGFLEYYELIEGLENVGGMGLLKAWLQSRRNAFTEEARNFGLPDPKGVLLIGVQGCGKSLIAKAIGSFWNLPLIRLDVGAVMEKWIGESERNIREAIQIAESISPAILWIDEIEKSFPNTGAYVGDSGTSLRIFSTFLNWLQEKTKPVFVVATANDISNLPPELVRKGRFDEIFFIDIPKEKEREEIFKIHLKKIRRDPQKFDIGRFLEQTSGFTGAEIESVIISALYDAFSLGRELQSDDIIKNIRETIPLSKTMQTQLTRLRAWAQDRVRFAAA